MTTLLKDIILVSMVLTLLMMVFRPRQFRQLGKQARKLGLIYVVAVLISAALHLAGWFL